jgi:hypothetical protein
MLGAYLMMCVFVRKEEKQQLIVLKKILGVGHECTKFKYNISNRLMHSVFQISQIFFIVSNPQHPRPRTFKAYWLRDAPPV